MGADIDSEVKSLTPEEITGIAPRDLLMHVVQGVKRECNFSIGIMLNVADLDETSSLGTRKVMISAPKEEASEACQFVRKNPLLKGRCAESDLWAFDTAEKKVLADSSYSGEEYWCRSLYLKDFVVPIYEEQSKTFIGVVLGGQCREPGDTGFWRLRQPDVMKKALEMNPDLLPFHKELQPLYEKVPVLDEAKFNDLKQRCRDIARDLAGLFRFYIQQKVALAKEEKGRAKREKKIAEIHKALIDAASPEEYWGIMPAIAGHVFDWLPVDWCLILRQRQDIVGDPVSGIEEVGRGSGSRGLPSKEEIEKALAKAGPFRNEEDATIFFAQTAKEGISADAHCLVFPVKEGGLMIAFLLVGSAPRLQKANTDYHSVKSYSAQIREVATAMGIEYGELVALEMWRHRSQELEGQKEKLAEQIQLREETLMSLNHQLHGPLWMLSGILTNVRDTMAPAKSTELASQIDVGVLVAQHGSLMFTGMAGIFAGEQGRRRPKRTAIAINVETELNKLADAMRRSSQSMYRTIDIGLGESPPIYMAMLDFLFIFYALLENALKYGDPDKDIRVGCSWEEKRQCYCFKVWSVGPPIDPEDVGNVFRKFWRHPEAWQDDELGLGLGCWAARQCMLRAGGDIYLEVNGPHSVFVVVPPRAKQDRKERTNG